MKEIYQIIEVIEHTETRETLLVCQALFGDFKICVRPLSMFTGRVDCEKYPDAKKGLQFEKVEKK